MTSLRVYNTSFLTPTPHICTSNGTWTVPTTVRIYTGSSWITVYTALAASISDRTINVTGSGSQSAIYRLSTNGNAYSTSSGTSGNLETWLDSGTNSDFECKATVTSGSLSSGTTGSWLALTTDRSWTKTSSSSATAVISVQIRAASTGTVLSTASITLQRTVSTTYNPVAGTYSDTGGGSNGAILQYSVTASASVAWSWSATGDTDALSSNIASGGSGTTITFSLTTDKFSDNVVQISLSSDGNNWTINLTTVQWG